MLIEAQGEWCVSMFMPTVRAGTEVQQNPIRFKNLLRRAEEHLQQLNARVPDIDRLLRPAGDLLDSPEFWRGAGDGLAVFVAPEQLFTYRLPLTFEELVIARQRFHIKPLLPLLSGDGRFYALAISQEQVRLLEGTRDSVRQVDLAEVPESLSEALQYDRPERQVRARGTRGGESFGYGGGEDEEVKLDIRRYFQMVDRGLRDVLAEQQVPLVLAGVDFLLPIYREANTYGYLLDTGITGNPETLSAKELHKRAWEIVRPHFTQAQGEQKELYLALAGRSDPRASNTLREVVQAAYEGRIATLFVAVNAQEWGVYRAHSHKVHVHPERQPGDQDLFDVAAAQTFANGGTIYAVEAADVPGGKAYAAIFRY
jgi:hypothetical protein